MLYTLWQWSVASLPGSGCYSIVSTTDLPGVDWEHKQDYSLDRGKMGFPGAEPESAFYLTAALIALAVTDCGKLTAGEQQI